MNRTFVTLAVILVLTGTGVSSWLYITRSSETRPIAAPTKEELSSTALNDSISPAAGAPVAPQTATQQPKTVIAPPVTARQPVSQMGGQNGVSPTAKAIGDAVTQIPAGAQAVPTGIAAATEKKKDAVEKHDMSFEEMSQIHEQVKLSIENDYKGKLSFPLDEAKMVAFTQASLRVKKINNKWDVQIAGVDTDTMAIEYNNLSVEEITKSLQSIPGLTLDQYNEMTRLTASDKNFNRAYQVYKELIKQGVVKTDAAAVVAPAVKTVPAVAAPVAKTAPATPQAPLKTTPIVQPPAAKRANSAAPANSGIPVGIEGLLTHQYSQPSSR